MTLHEQVEEISRVMLGAAATRWYTTPQRVDALCRKMFLHPEDVPSAWSGAVRRAGLLLENPGWIDKDEPAFEEGPWP